MTRGRLARVLAALILALALAAGAAAAHHEACVSNGDCPERFYCAKAPGDCGGEGECAERPEICTQVYDPVCGCDGKTYPNACHAAAAGASVAHAGECRAAAGCQANGDCGEGEYCEKPRGECDGMGECADRPEVCIQLYDPVCGCDAKTYSNACHAAAAGASVAHAGRCEEAAPPES